jgi:hypothetical protein
MGLVGDRTFRGQGKTAGPAPFLEGKGHGPLSLRSSELPTARHITWECRFCGSTTVHFRTDFSRANVAASTDMR